MQSGHSLGTATDGMPSELASVRVSGIVFLNLYGLGVRQEGGKALACLLGPIG